MLSSSQIWSALQGGTFKINAIIVHFHNILWLSEHQIPHVRYFLVEFLRRDFFLKYTNINKFKVSLTCSLHFPSERWNLKKNHDFGCIIINSLVILGKTFCITWEQHKYPNLGYKFVLNKFMNEVIFRSLYFEVKSA